MIMEVVYILDINHEKEEEMNKCRNKDKNE